MSTITLQLPPETERILRDRAEQAGQSMESLVRDIVVESVEVRRQPRFISEPKLTDAEFEAWVEEVASGAPGAPLPPDFSREDIYIDHD